MYNWSKRIKLTISGSEITEDLTDFPVLITLSSGTGINNTDVTAVFDELATVFGTKKIAVTTTVSGIETQLYTEIEYWDWSNEEACLWTKVPTLISGTNTDLYLYYDKNHADNTSYVGDTGSTPAQNVWDSNFKGVWHLTQDPTGGSNCVLDSTSNVNHGTPGGTMTSDIGCGTASSLDLTSLTIEAAAYKRDDGYNMMVDHAREGLNVENYVLGFTGSTIFFQYNNGGWKSLTKTNYVNNDVWFEAATTYDSGNIILYKDGAEVNSSSGNAALVIDTANVFKIARYQVGSQGYANMIIDEVRVSNIARPSSWIKATYYSNWNNLIIFGLEENIPTYYFSGYVYEQGSSVSRKLYLHNRSDGSLIDTTTSSENGYYYLETTHSGSHYIVCIDDAVGEDYNDLIIGNVIPTTASG